MLTIHVWPKWLKEFLLTHPLYKSPPFRRHETVGYPSRQIMDLESLDSAASATPPLQLRNRLHGLFVEGCLGAAETHGLVYS